MSKSKLTPEQIYKRNQKRSKVLRILAPIAFWGFLTLAFICLIFAIRNSFGNVAEIMDMLETKNHTGEELRENYEFLIEKYGEWIIGSGSTGFTISFINIGHALFSGIMITNCICFVIFLIAAYVFGKWLLPKWSEQILINNQDMVNLAVLKNTKKE